MSRDVARPALAEVKMSGDTAGRFLEIKKKISEAALSSGRDPAAINPMAVIKYAGNEDILTLLKSGLVTHAGESRVQDAVSRWQQPEFASLRDGLTLHFIGHLQKNKISKALDLFDFIDSVDNFGLAEAISSHAAKKNKNIKVLLQVNLTGSSTQGGVALGGVDELLKQVKTLPNLSVEGIMGIAPIKEPAEDLRPLFREVKTVFDKYFNSRHYLSLGMSGDYEAAVKEGANMPRIGSSIFG